jgi:hypothetical protein
VFACVKEQQTNKQIECKNEHCGMEVNGSSRVCNSGKDISLPLEIRQTARWSQSMPWGSPEEHREGNRAYNDNYTNKSGTSQEKFANVWFANDERPEWGGLASPEEYKYRVELILMTDEAEEGDKEWDKKLSK